MGTRLTPPKQGIQLGPERRRSQYAGKTPDSAPERGESMTTHEHKSLALDSAANRIVETQGVYSFQQFAPFGQIAMVPSKSRGSTFCWGQ